MLCVNGSFFSEPPCHPWFYKKLKPAGQIIQQLISQKDKRSDPGY